MGCIGRGSWRGLGDARIDISVCNLTGALDHRRYEDHSSVEQRMIQIASSFLNWYLHDKDEITIGRRNGLSLRNVAWYNTWVALAGAGFRGSDE